MNATKTAKMNLKTGFTIMELIIVVIILGIITGFAIPNFAKSLRKAHERDAAVQLSTIHAANKLYYSQTNQYAPESTKDLTNINTELNLNILANGMVYTYARPTPTTYTVTAQWIDGSNDFTLSMNQNSFWIGSSSSNPCCSAGACSVISDC